MRAKLGTWIKREGRVMWLGMAVWAGAVEAELPTAVLPEGGTEGNWLSIIAGFIKTGGGIIILAVALVAFVWFAYGAIAKFNEARKGKAEMVEVGVTSVVGVAVVGLIVVVLTVAKAVFD